MNEEVLEDRDVPSGFLSAFLEHVAMHRIARCETRGQVLVAEAGAVDGSGPHQRKRERVATISIQSFRGWTIQ